MTEEKFVGEVGRSWVLKKALVRKGEMRFIMESLCAIRLWLGEVGWRGVGEERLHRERLFEGDVE